MLKIIRASIIWAFVFLSAAFIFLWVCCLSARAQQGPVHTPQINTTYYVGAVSGFYPTIQSAVTKACSVSAATVSIPSGSTPGDTIGGVTGGCTTAAIVDERGGGPSTTYKWNGSAYVGASSTGSVASGTAGQIAQYPANGTTVQGATVSGDATLAPGGALTLTTVNGSPGTCGDATHVPQFAVNGKGLTTTCTPVAIAAGGSSVGAAGTVQAAGSTAGSFAAALPFDLLRTFGNPPGSYVHGDSIGYGTGALNLSLDFANLIRPQIGGNQTQYSRPGDQCLDTATTIVGNDGFPTGSYPTSIQECGTNDVTTYGSSANLQTVFKRIVTGNYLMAAVPITLQKWAQTCTKTTGFATAENNFRVGLGQSTTASGDVLTCLVNTGPNGNVAAYYRITNGGTGTFKINIAGTDQTDAIGSLGTTFDAFGDGGATITTANAASSGFVGQVFTGFTPNTNVNVVFTTTAASTSAAPVEIGFVAGLPATSALNPNVIVVSPNHQNNANDTLSGTYAGFEQSIVATLAGQGLNITYANTRDGMVSDPLCGNGSVSTMYTNCYADAIHPNGPTATTGGHASMARIIAAAVPSLITNAPPNLQNGPPNAYQVDAAVPLNPSQFWTPNPFMRAGDVTTGWAPGILLTKTLANMEFIAGTAVHGAVLAGPAAGGNVAASICAAGVAGAGFGSYTLASLNCPVHVSGNGIGAMGDDASGNGGFHGFNGTAYIGSFGAYSATGAANVTTPLMSFVPLAQSTGSLNQNSIPLEFQASKWQSTGGGQPGSIGITFTNVPRAGTNSAMYLTLGTLHNPSGDPWAVDLSTSTTPNLYGNGIVTTLGTTTNCSSSASPAVCGAAIAGSVTIAAAATTVVVNTTAVTANSQIFVFPDESLGTKLGVTCNTTAAVALATVGVTARTPGTNFTITTTGTVTTNPACYSYMIVN